MRTPSCTNWPTGGGSLVRSVIAGHPVVGAVWRRDVEHDGASARAVAKCGAQVVLDLDRGTAAVRPAGRLGEVEQLSRAAVGFDLHPWVDLPTVDRFERVAMGHVGRPPAALVAAALATTGDWSLRSDLLEIVDGVMGAVGGRGCGDLPMSARTVRRRLSAATGVSPDRMRVIARVARARALLHQPRSSIAAVAAQLGYTDQSHLHRDVVRWTGCTPGHWVAHRASWQVRIEPGPTPLRG